MAIIGPPLVATGLGGLPVPVGVQQVVSPVMWSQLGQFEEMEAAAAAAMEAIRSREATQSQSDAMAQIQQKQAMDAMFAATPMAPVIIDQGIQTPHPVPIENQSAAMAQIQQKQAMDAMFAATPMAPPVLIEQGIQTPHPVPIENQSDAMAQIQQKQAMDAIFSATPMAPPVMALPPVPVAQMAPIPTEQGIQTPHPVPIESPQAIMYSVVPPTAEQLPPPPALVPVAPQMAPPPPAPPPPTSEQIAADQAAWAASQSDAVAAPHYPPMPDPYTQAQMEQEQQALQRELDAAAQMATQQAVDKAAQDRAYQQAMGASVNYSPSPPQPGVAPTVFAGGGRFPADIYSPTPPPQHDDMKPFDPLVPQHLVLMKAIFDNEACFVAQAPGGGLIPRPAEPDGCAGMWAALSNLVIGLGDEIRHPQDLYRMISWYIFNKGAYQRYVVENQAQSMRPTQKSQAVAPPTPTPAQEKQEEKTTNPLVYGALIAGLYFLLK